MKNLISDLSIVLFDSNMKENKYNTYILEKRAD